MRRITARWGEEHGASAVLVAILMVPLLGFAAIALDVGALYVERGQLQNGADAAALAIAQGCAEDGVCTAAATEPTAAAFADANANDGAANVLIPEFPTANSVMVTSSTRVAGTNADAISHPFARFIGIDSTTVYAQATAEWGPPQASMIVLPLAISLCEFQPALDGSLQLLRYDQNPACTTPDGSPIPGGFGWLDRVEDECEAAIDLVAASAPSEPGNSFPGICNDTLTDLEGKTILVPIFDRAYAPNGTELTQGAGASFHLYAFAAFTITGWKFSGGPALTNTDPAAPDCTGNCRGIQGYFDRWVSVDSAGAELGGPDLGAAIIRLSK
ncbi:MAG: Tad domain-containing protein [Cryobacterium sp.]